MQTVAITIADAVADDIAVAIVESYNHLKEIVDRLQTGDEISNGFFRVWVSDGSFVDDDGSSDPLCRSVKYKCKKCPIDCRSQRAAYELNPCLKTAAGLLETRAK